MKFREVIVYVVMLILFSACTTTRQQNILNSETQKQYKEYEPKKLLAEIDKDVLIYFASIDVGFSSLKTNMISDKGTPQELIIKSNRNASFKIKDFTSCTLNEAIDQNDNVVSYLVVDYSIKPDSLYKLNEKIIDNKVSVIDLINAVSENDLNAQQKGSVNPPDPKKYTKLRQAFVYNFTVTTSNNEDIPLQVFVENINNIKDLK